MGGGGRKWGFHSALVERDEKMASWRDSEHHRPCPGRVPCPETVDVLSKASLSPREGCCPASGSPEFQERSREVSRARVQGQDCPRGKSAWRTPGAAGSARGSIWAKEEETFTAETSPWEASQPVHWRGVERVVRIERVISPACCPDFGSCLVCPEPPPKKSLWNVGTFQSSFQTGSAAHSSQPQDCGQQGSRLEFHIEPNMETEIPVIEAAPCAAV